LSKQVPKNQTTRHEGGFPPIETVGVIFVIANEAIFCAFRGYSFIFAILAIFCGYSPVHSFRRDGQT
jgi:hypothetical protein